MLIPFLDSPNDENTIPWITSYLNGCLAQSYFPILLKYLEDDRLEMRTFALNNLKVIGDDSILTILVSFLPNSEPILRESAVREILSLGSHETLPILLELAANHELLVTMISELQRMSHEEPILPIFEEFLLNPDFTQKFMDTAETTMIEMIESGSTHDPNILYYLGWIAITDRAVITIDRILKSDKCTYEDEDGGVNALEHIGTDLAINTLLEFLPNEYVLGGWIAHVLGRVGKLGIIPHLWSAQQKWFCSRIESAIEGIQKEAGLYNPNFSDRDHPLFQPIDNLRRKMLPS